MNRKEIITADLLARVQWGVKVYEKDAEEAGYFTLDIQNLYAKNAEEKKAKEQGFDYEIEFIPLLFNSFTEPITVAGYNDGLPFVPAEELAKIERTKNPRVSFPEMGEQDNFVHESDPDLIPIWMANLLNQWHINYRLLPGEYIPATNEYA